jgi:zinc and cadmium transporter
LPGRFGGSARRQWLGKRRAGGIVVLFESLWLAPATAVAAGAILEGKRKMVLLAIVLGTALAGVGSVWLAAALSFGALARYTQHMLSLAAGALLATAFVHLLPEAFEMASSPQNLFLTILSGLLFFFLLDKAELWHHGHEHAPSMPNLDEAMQGNSDNAGANAPAAPDLPAARQSEHAGHAHAHNHARVGGSWSVLLGDSVHCFGDGVLIASAFMADLKLGLLAALAVLAHEVPHHMGDLAVLRQAGRDNRRGALLKVSLAGSVTALGGLVSYWLLGLFDAWLPYFVALASSSFIYVALADLIPQLQKRLNARQTVAQLFWLAAGMALVLVMGAISHRLGHTHGHAHGATTGAHPHGHAQDHDHDEHDGHSHDDHDGGDHGHGHGDHDHEHDARAGHDENHAGDSVGAPSASRAQPAAVHHAQDDDDDDAHHHAGHEHDAHDEHDDGHEHEHEREGAQTRQTASGSAQAREKERE